MSGNTLKTCDLHKKLLAACNSKHFLDLRQKKLEEEIERQRRDEEIELMI